MGEFLPGDKAYAFTTAISGQAGIFRGYTEDTRPFGPEQSKALVEDYAQRRTQATEIIAADERKKAMQH